MPTTGGHALQPSDQRGIGLAHAHGDVLVRIILITGQDQKARERAVDDVCTLQCAPEVQRRRGAIDTQAGLIDIPTLV